MMMQKGDPKKKQLDLLISFVGHMPMYYSWKPSGCTASAVSLNGLFHASVSIAFNLLFN